MPAHILKKLSIAAPAFAASCAMLPHGSQPAVQESVEIKPAPQVAAAPAPKAAATSPAPEPRIFAGTGNFVNTAPPKAAPAPGPQEASLNFESLDVREVAKVILADYLHASYTVHPQVTGTVTFRTVRPIPVADLLPTLEMLLRQNNAAVVKEGDIYKVLPLSAVRGSVSPQLGGGNRPLPPGFSIVVVPLKYVGVAEMVKLLQPFSGENTIIADATRNLLIVAGGLREQQHVLDAIDLFDVDWLSGYSVGLYPVRSTDVKSLTADLDKVFGAAAQSPLAGIVRVIPIERMNGLLVVTTQPKYLEMAKTWIERIDQVGGTGGGTRLFVYTVRNGKAENLAQLVGDLFSTRRSSTAGPALAPGQRPAEIRSVPYGQLNQPNNPSGPGAGTTANPVTAPTSATLLLPGGVGNTSSEVRVIADKDTNSLLILATPGDYEIVENAIRRLDVMRRQVLVEVMLVEVALKDQLSLGLDWFIKTRNNTNGSMNVGGGLPPNGPVITPNNAVPAYTGLQLINYTADQVRAVLQTLGTDGKAKTLASPQIMVLDNEKAEIKVGTRISVQTQAQTGVTTTGVVNSFQYLETGVLLDVTPRINSGGMVTLDIEQEVSAPTSTPTLANPNPDIGTRNAKTSVAVASGESVALAGLIQESLKTGSTGVPLISKIPVLGALFGTQTFERDRTELVLIVTPKIVNNPIQAREVTDELREKMPTLEGMLPKTSRNPDPGADLPPKAPAAPAAAPADTPHK